MICEKCERIGRLNLIPHEVEEGDDNIAVVADCPWEWEKEEIENYVTIKGFEGLVKIYDENPGLPNPASLVEEASRLVGCCFTKDKSYFSHVVN